MTSTATQTAVRYERDADGIVTLTLDDPTASVNTMTALYREAMERAVDRLYAEQDDVTGVVLASAKRTFFAGGDLHQLSRATPADAQEIFDLCEAVKRALRRLELFPRPVVAAINGAALGGGLEIALAADHRIVVDDRSVKVGLPEVTLGLLPGGGGVTRVVRMLGLQAALMDVLLPGAQLDPQAALATGLVDELVATREELVPAAKAWIRAHPETVAKPWDRPGYRMPGGSPSSPELANLLPSLPALLRRQTRGAALPAPRAILAAAVEGAQVDVDTASRIESRYFTHLVVGQGSTNMIQAFFFDLQAVGPAVDDSWQPFLARLVAARAEEGRRLLAEGVQPVSLERAATQAGYAAGPLPGDELPAPTRLSAPAAQVPWRDVQDRLLVIEALETARCLEEGVVPGSAAANVASIMGAGFPPGTGGAAQLMTGYQARDERGEPVGDVGLPVFLARAEGLAEAYGERFRPTPYLRDLAARGEPFPR